MEKWIEIKDHSNAITKVFTEDIERVLMGYNGFANIEMNDASILYTNETFEDICMKIYS